MSVLNAKNNLSVIIGKTLSRTATVQYSDPNAASYLADGEVLVISESGAIMTNASTIGTAGRFRLVQRSGSRLIYSPVISGATVRAYKGIDGSAGSEQITYVGYNGTSGSIDVSGTNDFLLNMQFGFDESMWSEQANNFPFIVPNSGSVKQAYVAESLARQINYQFMNGNNAFAQAGEGPLVKATMVSADAGTALGAAGDTVIGFAGSKTVTITDTSTTSVALSAGDYIRVGTATTAAVYKIASSSKAAGTTGTVTLTMPLQADLSLLGTTSEYITAALADAAAAGVIITGQSLKWVKDFFKYLQVTFKVLLKSSTFGATTLSTTAAVRPVGSGKQVVELESFGEGFRGVLNRTIIPLPTGKADADSTATYDMIYIVWEDTTDVTPVDGVKPARQELYICFPDAAATQITDATNGVLTVLNAYMLTTPGRFANVSL